MPEREQRRISGVEVKGRHAQRKLRRVRVDIVDMNDRFRRRRLAGIFLVVVNRNLANHARKGHGQLARR